MKALVLAGGIPQIDLINKLKKRGYFTILSDYYEYPIARDYADKFYQISTLDVSAIKQLAIEENVDFLITVCTDQALLTVAQVSEELGLPCYIDYETARNVTNKAYMKKIFADNDIPSAKYMIFDNISDPMQIDWKYPVIVKPVDCNSSKGVTKVTNNEELARKFSTALKCSRTCSALIEEYIVGDELSVDAYIENGVAHILDITYSEKIKDEEKFVIFRTWHPAEITPSIEEKVEHIVQIIADAFKIKNSPMLVQMLSDGKNVYVLEFSARTGGGLKYLSIERQTGIDIVSTVIDLTEGKIPIIRKKFPQKKYMLDEYIYCKPGTYDYIEGFDELVESGDMLDYCVFKCKGAVFDTIDNSGDRVAGFSIVADTLDELNSKHCTINEKIKAVSTTGEDMIRHDLLPELY